MPRMRQYFAIPLLLFGCGCAGDPGPTGDSGDFESVETETDKETDTPAGDTDTMPGEPWTRDTADCVIDPRTCDTNCDGQPEDGAVIVRQPNGEILLFSDLTAGVAASEPSASVFLCPGEYWQNVTLAQDIQIYAADTGSRPRLRANNLSDVIITVAPGRQVTLVGLDIGGGVVPVGGGGSGSAGGSGGTGTPGGSGLPGALFETTGVLALGGSDLSIRHSLIHHHGERGIESSSASSLQISDSVIVRNAGNGGMFLQNTDDVSLMGVQLLDNFAQASGGGLHIDRCVNATLVDVRAVANRANGDGGGLRIDDCNVSFDDLTAESNVALDVGGGLLLASSTVTVGALGVTLVDNVALYGGGVYASLSPISGGAWNVERNEAQNGGGGVFLSSSTIDAIPMMRVEDNVAGTDGGGVYLDPDSALTGGELHVSGNTAFADGGGAFMADETALGPGIVEFNVAGENGGGVYVNAPPPIPAEVLPDLLDNTARQGGGLYVANGSAVFSGRRIWRNTSSADLGGGAVIGPTGLLTVDGADLGVGADDNTPPDVYPWTLSRHVQYGADACFTCNDEACSACP